MRSRSILLTGLCGAAFLVSLALLCSSFLASMASAGRLFDRAAAAETQRVYVSRIETLIHGGDRIALTGMLDRYLTSVSAEASISPSDSEAVAAQRREANEADRLRTVSLAADTDTVASATPLIAAIAERERREASQLADEMRRLRARTAQQAIWLAVFAAGAVLIGGAGLFAANRRLTREVARRTAELAAIDRSRRLFFAKASHELRTPVTEMRGDAEVALSGQPSSEALCDALRHVVANAEFLDHRIEELLGLARADDGQLQLRMEPLDFGTVLETACAAARSYATSSEVGLEIECPPDPIPISGDSRWLGQALLAVIDNGVKFSSAGGMVGVLASRDATSAHIAIVDRGIGVAPPALPRIFDAYYQTEDGRSRGGTGLGLALARWVVEQHGGTIAARETPGGGCTIAISLPIAA